MASTTSSDLLPSGSRIFTTIPDLFFIPEFVFGGLVWMLVASTLPTLPVFPGNPLGWVMFVSVFCFVMTTLWFFIFACGANQGGIWPSLDVAYHFVAVVMYLSASVALATITLSIGSVNASLPDPQILKIYRLDIAAVVMSFLTTLLYFLHTIFSALRWKSS